MANDQKLGRNDPCWCGSGKKLKKCHGTTKQYPPRQAAFHIPPSKRPDPTTTHLEKHGENWIERPGLLAVRLTMDAVEDVDAELANFRKEWGILLQGHSLPSMTIQTLASRLNDVQDKLQGVRYHRDNFARHESEIEQQISSSSPPTGAQIQMKRPGLVFEVEGFLYQSKSTLDMLAQLLRDAGFRSLGDSFGDHGDRIVNQLRQPPAACAQEAQSFINLIEEAQSDWIDQLVLMRDQVAHHGILIDMGSFVQHPYIGGTYVALTYPHLPDGQRVHEYLKNVEQKLRSFANLFVVKTLSCAAKLVTKS